MDGVIAFVDDQGITRHLGNLEAPLRFSWDISGGGVIIPRSQWRETDLSAFVSPIKNQKNTSSCNAFSSINCMEACRRMAGLRDVLLSPANLYGRINGGRDQGSYLEDAIKVLAGEGVCSAATVPELSWQPSTWPASWKSEALSYKAEEWSWTPGFDGLASAIQRGEFCNMGLLWYQNYNPARGQGGWITTRPSNQLGGHAVCGCGLIKHPSGDGWGIKFPNTWGLEWGEDGFGILPEPALNNKIGGFWTVRSVTTESGDIPTPRV